MTQRKRETAAWQERGYRMEDAECEHELPINDQNDTGFLHGEREDWDGDPFDDSAVDEQMKEDRSDDLESHESEFWDNPAKPPKGSGIERAKPKNTALDSMKDRLGSLNRRVSVGIVLSLAAIVAIALLVVNLSMRVRTVRVTLSGDIDQRYDDGSIANLEERIMAVVGNSNIRTLDEDRIRREIAQNPYLTVTSITRNLPDTVLITIRVRNAYAWIEYNSMRFILDGRGMVLEQVPLNVEPALPRVKFNAPDIRRCVPGSSLTLASTQGLGPYLTLTEEVKALGLTDEIRMYDMTSAENLMLETRDGYYVSLGGADRIHAKLRAMILVREELASMEKTGGTIYVSTPEKPTWRP